MAQSEETKIAVLAQKLESVEEGLLRVEAKLDNLTSQFVTKLEFELFKKGDFGLVKKVVFGGVGLILTGFIIGVIMLVFNTNLTLH